MGNKKSFCIVFLLLMSIAVFSASSFFATAADATTSASSTSAPLFTAPGPSEVSSSSSGGGFGGMTDIMLLLMTTGMLGNGKYSQLALLLPLVGANENMKKFLVPLGLAMLLTSSGGKAKTPAEIETAAKAPGVRTSPDKTEITNQPESGQKSIMEGSYRVYQKIESINIDSLLDETGKKVLVDACAKFKSQIQKITSDKKGIFLIKTKETDGSIAKNCEIFYFFVGGDTLTVSNTIVKYKTEEEENIIFKDIAGIGTAIEKISSSMTEEEVNNLADQNSFIKFEGFTEKETVNNQVNDIPKLRISAARILSVKDDNIIQIMFGKESKITLEKDASLEYALSEKYLEYIKIKRNSPISISTANVIIATSSKNEATDGLSSNVIYADNKGTEFIYSQLEEKDTVYSVVYATQAWTTIGKHEFYSDYLVGCTTGAGHKQAGYLIRLDENGNVAEAALESGAQYAGSDGVKIKFWKTDITDAKNTVNQDILIYFTKTRAGISYDFRIDYTKDKGIVIRGSGDAKYVKGFNFNCGETPSNLVNIDKNANSFAVAYNEKAIMTTKKDNILSLIYQKDPKYCIPKKTPILDQGKIKVYVGCVGGKRTAVGGAKGATAANPNPSVTGPAAVKAQGEAAAPDRLGKIPLNTAQQKAKAGAGAQTLPAGAAGPLANLNQRRQQARGTALPSKIGTGYSTINYLYNAAESCIRKKGGVDYSRNSPSTVWKFTSDKYEAYTGATTRYTQNSVGDTVSIDENYVSITFKKYPSSGYPSQLDLRKNKDKITNVITYNFDTYPEILNDEQKDVKWLAEFVRECVGTIQTEMLRPVTIPKFTSIKVRGNDINAVSSQSNYLFDGQYYYNIIADSISYDKQSANFNVYRSLQKELVATKILDKGEEHMICGIIYREGEGSPSSKSCLGLNIYGIMILDKKTVSFVIEKP